MTAEADRILLDVRNLGAGTGSADSPARIVDGIDFRIRGGEALGLVGESGSGKSTIAAAVLDLLGPGLRVLSGEVLYKGRDLRLLGAGARRRLLGIEIGAVFQDPFTSLNPSLRVGGQIAESLRVHRGIRPAEARKMTRALLADVGITDPAATADAYQHQLSGGMRQRALIAMALACDPALLVLDEPTTALDAEVEAQLLALLQRLRRERGLSLLFISHNLAVVRRLCDRIAVLYAGEIVEVGSADQVLSDPLHPYTRALLDCVPRLEAGRCKRLSPIAGNTPGLAERGSGCRFRSRCEHVRPGCELPQGLAEHEGRQVRCWRVSSIDPEPKPIAAAAPTEGGGLAGGTILSAAHLSKSYRQGSFWSAVRLSAAGFPLRLDRQRFHAVRNTTLDLRRGEILGLVGQSGSGKSSLGRMLLRLDEPTSGSIAFDGEDITRRPPRTLRDFRRRAQMVFQNPDASLNPRISIGDILARPLRVFGVVAPEETGHEVDRLLDLVHLPAGYKTRFAHELSGGEKQRVGIARAMASRPEVLVCDEPVSALDVSVQAAVVGLIESLRAELNLSVLFISHDMAVVSYLCDRIAVMHRGQICEIGPARQILAEPSHPYTRRLIAAVRHTNLSN